MSRSRDTGPVTPEMNITPLIDVVFLLIIFFMLVNNIMAEENVKMVVPKLNNPKTKDLGDVERIVVNIEPNQNFDPGERRQAQNPLLHSGRANRIKVGNNWFAANRTGMEQAEQVLRNRIAKSSKNDHGESKLQVLLRADAALYYSEVQPVMAMITAAGIGKVDLVAYMPEDHH